MSKQQYTFHGAVGIFIKHDGPTYGTLVFSYDPWRTFNGWIIGEREVSSYPNLEPYLGMQGWNIELNGLTKVNINLGEIYE